MEKVIHIKTGEKVILHHLKKPDIDGVWKNFNDVLKEGIYLPVFTPVKTEIEKTSWYENIKNDHEICVVAEISRFKPPNNIIGQCEISNLEWEAATHVGSLGIIVSEKYREMGIGRNLIDMAIRESKLLNNKEKIILSCFSTNERALNLYKKLGFKVVGTRKKQFYMDSVYYDEVLMEISIEDYIKNNPE
ncbi:MAG: GNAT family N-acetyltransferase [Candidatus Hermodarchaeota archaeon]